MKKDLRYIIINNILVSVSYITSEQEYRLHKLFGSRHIASYICTQQQLHDLITLDSFPLEWNGAMYKLYHALEAQTKK